MIHAFNFLIFFWPLLLGIALTTYVLIREES